MRLKLRFASGLTVSALGRAHGLRKHEREGGRGGLFGSTVHEMRASSAVMSCVLDWVELRTSTSSLPSAFRSKRTRNYPRGPPMSAQRGATRAPFEALGSGPHDAGHRTGIAMNIT